MILAKSITLKKQKKREEYFEIYRKLSVTQHQFILKKKKKKKTNYFYFRLPKNFNLKLKKKKNTWLKKKTASISSLSFIYIYILEIESFLIYFQTQDNFLDQKKIHFR